MYPNCDIFYPNECAEGYAVYTFNIQETDFHKSIPKSQKGNVKIEAHFKTALSENVVMLICAEFPTILSIDELRNVSIVNV